MTCSKCGGLAVLEQSLDFYDRTDRWRCVNCGWSLMKNPWVTAVSRKRDGIPRNISRSEAKEHERPRPCVSGSFSVLRKENSMKHIGDPMPRFRAPALVAGRLTYLDSAQLIGRWTALCFLPYVSIVEPAFLDHEADRFDRLDTTLLIISSGTRPLHRVWIDCQTKPRTPLLYDPLARLHRSFGIVPGQTPVRCRTFLIDRAGILRYHLVHDFTERGMSALHEIVTLSQTRDTGHIAAKDTIAEARKEIMNS